MTVEIISWSISTKVWDRTGIELATPGSAVRHASVARHVTDCATLQVKSYKQLRIYDNEHFQFEYILLNKSLARILI